VLYGECTNYGRCSMSKNIENLKATALSTDHVVGRLGGAVHSPTGKSGAGTDRIPGEQPISRRKPKGG
jgi:hypothetical protein